LNYFATDFQQAVGKALKKGKPEDRPAITIIMNQASGKKFVESILLDFFPKL